MMPARSNIGAVSQNEIMVDSSPNFVGPPSRIKSIFPDKSLATCSAVTELICPERFAEGAAMGRPSALMSLCAVKSAGILRATLSRPARARSHTEHRDDIGATIVSGPGQNCSANFKAVSENLASFVA